VGAVTSGLGTRLVSGHVRAHAAGATAALLLLIGLPFLAVSPSSVRGVPGPLLIVVCLAASFLLGPWWGVPLTCLGVALAVVILGENRFSEPLVWIPTAAAAGILGERVRRVEMLRRELLAQLRADLAALSSSPATGPFDVVARYLPAEGAQVLAGDFYGVVARADGSIALMVGDVAGHGPGAAAVATHLRAAWQALAAAGVPAQDAVRVLDETLRAERATGAVQVAFATLLVGWIAPDLASARFVLAGHQPPILITPADAAEVRLSPERPLGIEGAAGWDAHEVSLPAGSWTLLCYTDGLVEGRAAPDGERPFGTERLTRALAGKGALGPDQVDDLLERVRSANGDAMPDDIVLLAVSPRGAVTGVS
jgi:hypothetical protein